MHRSGKQWFQTLKNLGIIQERKKHINFRRDKLYENAVFLDSICANLADELLKGGAHLSTVDRVAGGVKCAIFAHDLARQVSRRRSIPCLSAHLTKGHVFEHSLNAILKKTERTVLCVDVLDREAQVKNLIRAVKEAGGIPLPYLVTLWNCTGSEMIHDTKIVSLISSKDAVVHV